MPGPLDLLVLGSGVAGLSAAVRAASVPGLRVGVLSKADLSQSTTRWAQGGVAAALGGDEDSTDLHLADTLAAGAGLCDTDAVRVLVDEGLERVNELIAMGAVFDQSPDGRLALAREGGHSVPRVVHAGGAATGAEIERAMVEAARHSATAIFERWFAVDLIVDADRCRGVIAMDPSGRTTEVRAEHVLLASGGAGQLFSVTTNPTEATGDGIAMALRAGVPVSDVEFMQFHPTALHHPAMPRPLLSEALRGHGALLRDSAGNRFVDELSPRDVVSRAMAARMLEERVDHLWLDATGLENFDERFPTIARSLRSIGLDPSRDWLPIAPAAHFISGGVVTDLNGASALGGLWAAGEVACTGVHGANRLASNSLLEGMVFGARVVEAVEAGLDGPEPTGAMRAILNVPGGAIGVESLACAAPEWYRGPWLLGEPEPRTGTDTSGTAELRAKLQSAMTQGAGVLRSASSLKKTSGIISEVVETFSPLDRSGHELTNLCVVAWALLAAALEREESRGAHTRTDFLETDGRMRHRLVCRLSGHRAVLVQRNEPV